MGLDLAGVLIAEFEVVNALADAKMVPVWQVADLSAQLGDFLKDPDQGGAAHYGL